MRMEYSRVLGKGSFWLVIIYNTKVILLILKSMEKGLWIGELEINTIVLKVGFRMEFSMEKE